MNALLKRSPGERQLAWVLGRGGLLGTHLEQALQASQGLSVDLFLPPFPNFAWSDLSRLEEQLRGAVEAFAARLPGYSSWAIFWAAGAGVIGTPPGEFARERQALALWLELIGRCTDNTGLPGVVVQASSAGGVYGGCQEDVISESSQPSVISPYGQAKIEQEEVLRGWARGHPEVRCLLARLSNIYGPGQNLSKPQGFISHVSRCILHRRPVRVYVPLDTSRDYLHVEDCARGIVRATRALCLGASQGTQPLIKIFASERSTSLAQVLGIFKKISKQRVLVVSGLSANAHEHPRRMAFRSEVLRDEIPGISLLEGIFRLHAHQTSLYQAGALPP